MPHLFEVLLLNGRVPELEESQAEVQEDAVEDVEALKDDEEDDE